MQQLLDAIGVDNIEYPFHLQENQAGHVFVSKEAFVDYLKTCFGDSVFGKMTQKQIDLFISIMNQVRN